MELESKKKLVRGGMLITMLIIYLFSGYAFMGGVSVDLTENSEAMFIHYVIISSFEIIISLILLNETLLLIFRRRKTVWAPELRVFSLFIYGFFSLLYLSLPLMRLAAADLSPALKWGVLGSSSDTSFAGLIGMTLLYLIARYTIKSEKAEEAEAN